MDDTKTTLSRLCTVPLNN